MESLLSHLDRVQGAPGAALPVSAPAGLELVWIHGYNGANGRHC